MGMIEDMKSISLDRQLVIQEKLYECIHTLYENKQIDHAIRELLRIIGEYYGAERAYVFEMSDDGMWMHNTYEWCKEGIESQIDLLGTVEASLINRWMPYFENEGEFYLKSRSEELDEESYEYQVLAAENVESLMAAPLRLNGVILGFMGVDNPTKNTDTLLLIRSVEAFIMNDIQKRETVEQRAIKSLANIYNSMYYLDLDEDHYLELTSQDYIHRLAGRDGEISTTIQPVMNVMAIEEDREKMRAFTDMSTLQERMKDETIISVEFQGCQSGWVRACFVAVHRDDDGRLQQALFTTQVIDAQKRRELDYQEKLQRALENQNEIYTEILHMQSTGIIALRIPEFTALVVNEAVKREFGCRSEEEFDHMLSSIFDKITVENKEHLIRHLKNMTEPGAKKVYEFGIGKEDGTYGYIMAEACVVQLSNGERIQIHCLTDITEKRKLETQLLQMSETDPLTHISNRRSGEARIQALLKSGKGGMLCLLDVDHFKKVNDTYGHSAGDQVLVSIASCLQNSFREQDVIMRLGGDEFAIYALRIADEETGERCIQRFFREVEKIHIDEIGDHRISVTLGAVLCPSNDEQEYNVLYKKADQAMYGKKNESGNQYDFYRGES